MLTLAPPLTEVSTGWGKLEEGEEDEDEEEEEEVSGLEEPNLEFCAGCALRGNLEPNCLLESRGERTLPLDPTAGRRGRKENEPVLLRGEDDESLSTLSLSPLWADLRGALGAEVVVVVLGAGVGSDTFSLLSWVSLLPSSR